jgi:hypothetical protein
MSLSCDAHAAGCREAVLAAVLRKFRSGGGISDGSTDGQAAARSVQGCLPSAVVAGAASAGFVSAGAVALRHRDHDANMALQFRPSPEEYPDKFGVRTARRGASVGRFGDAVACSRVPHVRSSSNSSRGRSMLRLLLLAVAIASPVALTAQSFSLRTTPDTIVMRPGQTATFHVDVIPADGFRATVNLHVLFPTLGRGAIFTTPPLLNDPYTGGASFQLTLNPSEAGRHAVVVEGWNGGYFVRDTVSVTLDASAELRGWSVYTTRTSPLPSDTINALETGRDGSVWIATPRGLARVSDGAWRVWPLPDLRRFDTGVAVLYSLALDSAGGVWVGATHMIAHLVGDTWRYYSFGDGTLPLANSPYIDMAVAPDRTVYALHNGGVLRFDGSVWSPMADAPSGSRIAIDREGAIDVVAGDRIYRFDGRFWSTLPREYLGVNALIYDEAFDRQWNRWYLTSSGGAHVVDDTVRYVGSNQFIDRYTEEYSSLAFAGDGTLWLSGASNYYTGPDAGSGVAHVDGKLWTMYDRTNSGLPSNSVTIVRVDRLDRLWAATAAYGVAMFDPRVAAVERDRRPERGVSVSPNPASGRCAVRFALARRARVSVSLVDVLGRVLRAYDATELEAGEHAIALDLDGLAAGPAFVRIVGDGATASVPLGILR